MNELENLKALKIKLYNDAKNNGRLSNIALCCRELGEPVNDRYGPKYSLNIEGMTVFVDDYGNYMTVRDAGGKKLCSTHFCDQIFSAGNWFKPILAMTEAAVESKRKRKSAKREAEASNLKSALGV